MRSCVSERRAIFRLAALGSLAIVCGCSRLEPASATDGNGAGSSAGSSTSGGAHASAGADGGSGATGSRASGGSSSDTGLADGGTVSLARGPTPADGGVHFPFPQNRQASRCTYPGAYSNDDVHAAYAKWYSDLVVKDSKTGFLRIQRTATDGVDTCRPANSTVSEGVAYGMLIAVYMDDQNLFDGLWRYEQQNLDANGLMNWAPDGAGNGCGGGATDADEDMAFALVMADRQWGGQGTIGRPYKQAAIKQIQTIWATEIFNYSWVRAGDGPWATATNQNISYFAPSYYRVFAQVDPNTCPSGSDVAYATMHTCDRWWGVVDQSYATLADALDPANGNQNNGLVPAWCDDSNGAPCRASSGQTFMYQYDSCRTPFRIGLDWCWNGEARAQAYVAKTSTFFAGLGAAGIADGFALNGTPQPGNPLSDGGTPLSAAFVGPAAVGAMSSSRYQSFVDQSYRELRTDALFVGGEYYSSSWTVLSLLMLSGNFLDYTQEMPLQGP